MSKLAMDHNAINLSQGFPDFECPQALVTAVNTAMKEGHNQYAPMPGVMRLREMIAEKRRNYTGQNTIQKQKLRSPLELPKPFTLLFPQQ